MVRKGEVKFKSAKPLQYWYAQVEKDALEVMLEHVLCFFFSWITVTEIYVRTNEI